ncbi:MAG: creatininase family protein [Deltaproteobacteria bacterium]|nr:creatininase family protein [Deltaproteobacteria bacterium]
MPFSDTPLPPNAFRYENLRLDDLRGRDLSKDIVIIPVSPCENHGTHLPTGTDIYITEEFARRVAGIYGARHPETRLLLYPHITVGSATIRGMGSVKITSRQLRRGLLFLCRRFMVLGFRHFVFFSRRTAACRTRARWTTCAKCSARGARRRWPPARARRSTPTAANT